MKKYMYIENGVINGCGSVMQLNPETTNIEISDEVYNEFVDDNLKYIYKSGQIIANSDYEKLKKQQVVQEEINNLKATLDDLDKKRIRAICENEIKDDVTNETWLDYYNNEISNIRKKITELSGVL